MSDTSSLLGRALREPLVQFALPAALLFSLSAWSGGQGDEVIRVTPEVLDAIVAEREVVLGRTLTRPEREALVGEFVRDEVLFREAVARGFDRSDGKVREHLVNKMMFLLDEEPPEPTDAQLEAFYHENRELFTTTPSVSLEHAFFQATPPEATSVLERLRDGVAPERLGDPFYLGSRIGYVTTPELAAALGVDFATAVEGLAVDEWTGPVASARGAHFVRVTARHEARLLALEDVALQLRNAWVADRVERTRAERVAELGERYAVVVEPARP